MASSSSLKSPLFFFFLCFSLQFSTAQLSYFLNCGSAQNATLDGRRNFTSDAKPTAFQFSGRRSSAVTNTNKSQNNPLYTNARIFRTISTYQFQVPQNNTYILRLHFYPFNSSELKLGDAQFDVTANGHLLLSDFSTEKKDFGDSSFIKEFIFRVEEGGFLRVHFVPKEESFAFVNAIEVVGIDLNVTQVVYKGRKSKVLQTIYRVNVGDNDPHFVDGFYRVWIPDDPFLINKNEAKNAPSHADTGVTWLSGRATKNDAPERVYETAKLLKSDSVPSNLTWGFNVQKGERYVVRAHFCDITNGLNPYMFYVSFYANFRQVIAPFELNNRLAVPFFEDFVVESGGKDVGVVNVTLVPMNGTYMFLNGLEIFQIKEGVASDPPIASSSSSKLGLIVGGVVGVFACVVVVCVVFVVRKKKRTKPVEQFEWAMEPLQPVGGTPDHRSVTSSHGSNLSNLQLGLKIPFVEIKRITNNFDPSLIIGEGGFGKVYKGTLRNGCKVAVKRSSSDHGQGLLEFQTEIMVLSKIRHFHLVALIGYCYELDEMVLVYEFMEKGTLRDHLYDPSRVNSQSSRLSWKQRLEICIGAAKGIQYLHTGLDSGIIHRDVKSTNILLDKNYVAKVADFGLSRSQHLEKSHVSTQVKGTFGYLDPEYFTCLQLTEKSDIYSFGVLLLEVLSARAVIDPSLPNAQINLAQWAICCIKEGDLETIIDPLIRTEVSLNSVSKFVEIAEKCLKESATERPPMGDVLWDLEYALQLQKMAEMRNVTTDNSSSSAIDNSMSVGFHVVRRFPSVSFADDETDMNLSMEPENSQVFSQLSFERDGGR